MPKTPTPPKPKPTPTPKRSTIKDVQAGLKALKPVIAKQNRTPSAVEKIVGAVAGVFKGRKPTATPSPAPPKAPKATPAPTRTPKPSKEPHLPMVNNRPPKITGPGKINRKP